MVFTCAVAICKNTNLSPCYKFPKDSRLRRAWILACHRKDTFDPDKSRVCSLHFKEEDFDRDLRNELLGLPLRKLKREDAVPSLLLLPQNPLKRSWNASENAKGRQERCQKRRRKEIVEDLAATAVQTSILSTSSPASSSSTSSAPVVTPASSSTSVDFGVQVGRHQTVDHFRAENGRLLDQLRQQRRSLFKLRKEVKPSKKKLEELVKVGVRKALHNYFSPAQVRIILEKKSKSYKWNRKDIVNGLVLKSFSQKAYQFIREKKLLPLPSTSTLRRWIYDFDCKPGIQESALQGTNSIQILHFIPSFKYYVEHVAQYI